MVQNCNLAIVGGGVVGVALARELSKRFSDILLFEKENTVAFHTSGRNSGVIHSGINPRPGTLKARLCVEGSRLLRDYCREHAIPHEQNGTLVVALEASQIPVLRELRERAITNGVAGVEILAPERFREYEPNARGEAALYSPAGALVDSAGLTQALARDAQMGKVRFIFGEKIETLKETAGSVLLRSGQNEYAAQRVINCAGLQADRLAHQLNLAKAYTILPFRGEYFVLDVPERQSPVRSMIYPVPDLRFPFLGVHLTKTLAGGILIGPNAVPALGRESYRSSEWSARDLAEMVAHRGFWNALIHNRRLVSIAWQELKNSFRSKYFIQQANRLAANLNLESRPLKRRAGIRAQLVRSDGELVEDLVIECSPRSVHVLNVVSPGMTSALAFARWFGRQMDDEGRWMGGSAELA